MRTNRKRIINISDDTLSLSFIWKNLFEEKILTTDPPRVQALFFDYSRWEALFCTDHSSLVATAAKTTAEAANSIRIINIYEDTLSLSFIRTFSSKRTLFYESFLFEKISSKSHY